MPLGNCQTPGQTQRDMEQEQGCRLLFKSHAVNPSRGGQRRKSGWMLRRPWGVSGPDFPADRFGDRTEQTCPKRCSSLWWHFLDQPAVGAHTEDPYQIRVLLKANSGWPLRDQTKGICASSTPSQEGDFELQDQPRQIQTQMDTCLQLPSPKWPLS